MRAGFPIAKRPSLKTFARRALFACLCLAASTVSAGAVIGTATFTPWSSTEVKVTIYHTGWTAHTYTDGQAQGHLYNVCWRQTNQWTIPCLTEEFSTNSQTFLIQGLTVGLPIHVQVWCWCKWNAIIGWPLNRQVIDMDYTLTAQTQGPAYIVSSTTVRLHNVQTNQCLYLVPNGAYANSWGCWADPNMRFSLDTFSDGHKQLRHLNSGACLQGGPPNTPSLNAWACGYIGTSVQIDGAGGSAVRINIPITKAINGFGPFNFPGPGGCVRTGSSNGTSATKQPCQADPALLFTLDPA